MNTLSATRKLTLALAFSAFAIGCDHVNESNYDKLQPGMTEGSVERIMGFGRQNTELARGIQFPSDVTGINEKSVQYGSNDKFVLVLYEDGRLKDKMKRGF